MLVRNELAFTSVLQLLTFLGYLKCFKVYLYSSMSLPQKHEQIQTCPAVLGSVQEPHQMFPCSTDWCSSQFGQQRPTIGSFHALIIHQIKVTTWMIDVAEQKVEVGVLAGVVPLGVEFDERSACWGKS